MDKFQSSDGYNLSSFPRKQKYICQSKKETICKVTRHVQYKVKTVARTRNLTYHITSQFNSTVTL